MEPSINDYMKKIKKNRKVVAVILFGSYAKRKTKPISDIDLAIIVRNPDSKTEAELGSLYSEKLDVVLFHRLPLYIQFEVFKHGKILFTRNKKYLHELKRRILREYLDVSPMYERISKRVFA